MKCGFLLYRKWGYEILRSLYKYQKIRQNFVIDTIITIKKSEFNIASLKRLCKNVIIVDPQDHDKIYNIVKERKIDILFCYSWSWLIKEPLFSDVICLALHPSPLPRYRGGTPIQHQILGGETESAVSVFRIGKGIDDGDIYYQTPISFLGDIKDIFNRMIDVGVAISQKLVADFDNGNLVFVPQKNLNYFPIFKRRKPEMSELPLNLLKTWSYERLNNFIRALTDPYPNAFVYLQNQILNITKIEFYKNLPYKYEIIRTETKVDIGKQKYCFETLDGYAVLIKFKVRNLEF